ncbi:DUF368 domain-containing protein [Lipingzhangella sp. LS1_29]|uniref:DUF368 domain-containing protein n=1 Tax=Lipingzhangella rawalii TaxID=2055835 RepID=A0ABU2H6R0_9ACTN|nr:DUF368 domain-containing protein [Lipingzhangella rawalii]MDS1270985.1 DUF368 domain-containing protein [Lipingzhangella rawalii]
MAHAATSPQHRPAPRAGFHLLNGIRGALIGTAEIVPGVSGGTIALITGVYERLISSAGHVLSGIKCMVADLPRGRGWQRASGEFRQAHWAVVVAVLIGMVLAFATGLPLLAPLLEHYRPQASAVFFGLVLASLWVPYSQSGGRWRAPEWLLAAVMTAGAFFLTGLPMAQGEPGSLAVLGAASVAVSGLVLPGVSGAFLLEVFGVYEPASQAARDLDFAFIGTFAVGAVIGLVVIVKVLQWLLEHHHRVTLVIITGLMAGALRAMWPWQPWEVDGDRSLLAPTTDVGLNVSLIVAGFAVVTAILVIERMVRARSPHNGSDAQAASSTNTAPTPSGSTPAGTS